MSHKERQGGSSIFSTKRPGGPQGRGDKKAERPGASGKGPGKPSRPLAELRERMAKDARCPGRKKTLRQRLAAAFPLFGFIGLPEIGLAIIIAGAVLMIWVWSHLLHWGLLVVGLGFLIMRYGERWLKGE